MTDPRVKALMEAAKEVKADCIARADKNGVVPIGRGAWDQLTAALSAIASPSIATPLDDPLVAALVALINRAQDIIDPCYPAKHAVWQNDARAALSALEENK